MGFLKSKHTAHTDEESVEGEQFGSLLLIAGKAMEDTSAELGTVFLEYRHQLVLCLAAVDDEREADFDGPSHLFLEALQLLVLVFATPIEVKPHLADSNKLGWRRLLNPTHLGNHLAPVGAHILGMESYHGVCKARIALHHGAHFLQAFHVYGRHKYCFRSSIAGTGNHLIAIEVEFLTVNMRVCVNKYHQPSIIKLQFSLFII